MPSDFLLSFFHCEGATATRQQTYTKCVGLADTFSFDTSSMYPHTYMTQRQFIRPMRMSISHGHPGLSSKLRRIRGMICALPYYSKCTKKLTKLYLHSPLPIQQATGLFVPLPVALQTYVTPPNPATNVCSFHSPLDETGEPTPSSLLACLFRTNQTDGKRPTPPPLIAFSLHACSSRLSEGTHARTRKACTRTARNVCTLSSYLPPRANVNRLYLPRRRPNDQTRIDQPDRHTDRHTDRPTERPTSPT